QMNNGVIGLLSLAVLENSDIGSRRNGLPYALGKLNRAMVRVVMVDEAADDIGSRTRLLGYESRVQLLRASGQSRSKEDRCCDESAKCERTAQANSYQSDDSCRSEDAGRRTHSQSRSGGTGNHFGADRQELRYSGERVKSLDPRWFQHI